jgi:DNA mismatch repair ATPase MutL
MTFENDKQPAVRWRKRPCTTSLEAVGLIFGGPLAKNLHVLDIPTGHGIMVGLVANLSATPSVVARSQADRCFTLVNNRVVDLPEFYATYRRIWMAFTQSTSCPFLLLQLTLPPSQVDVNMSADKRQCLLTSEELLLSTFSQSLEQYYQHQDVDDVNTVLVSSGPESKTSAKITNRPSILSLTPPVTNDRAASTPADTAVSAMPARKRVKASTAKLQPASLGCRWSYSIIQPKSSRQGLRPVRQLDDGTWLCSDGCKVFVFDLQG